MSRRIQGGRVAGVLAVLLAVMLPAAPARAADLWDVFVTATDGSGTPDLSASGSSLPDLLFDLVNAQGAFASYAGVAFSADIGFAGVADVINVTVDPAAGTATLTITALGAAAQTFTFTGPNLSAQIEQFLQDNIGEQLTALLSRINALALISVTDGTPLSTTALSASYVFDRFALHADLTNRERRLREGETVEAGVRGRLDTYYDRIDTDVGEGHAVAIAPSLEYVFDERVSLGMLFPIAWHEIEGSDILNAHFDLAMPVNVLLPDETSPWAVRVTPFASLAGSGSVDMVAGGLLAGGGLLGTATLLLDDLTLSVSGQYSVHESVVLRYEDFEFDPGVSQQILKGGVKVTHAVGEDLYVYGSIVYSTFVQEAAIDEYWTAGAGLGWRTPGGFSLTAGYTSDIADGYRTYGLRATLQLPF